MRPRQMARAERSPASLVDVSARSTLIDWLPAALIAAWNVGSAPFLTKYVVEPVRGAMGAETFVAAMVAAVAGLGIAVLIGGALHLRQERWQRLALMFAGLSLVAGYVVLSQRGDAEVAVVEHLHFVTYGSLAVVLLVPLRGLRLIAPVGMLTVLLLVALLDEGMQWLVPVRTGEMFDIGLNLYAGLAGTLVGLGLFSLGAISSASREGERGLRIGWRPEKAKPMLRWPSPASAARQLVPLAVLATLVAAVFIQLVHLGHEIVDPDVGRFRSFFPVEQLEVENRRAAAEWAVQPPGELTPFEREDWFRTEAGWHLLARDLAQSKEQWVVTDRENAILLRYYPAFLEHKSWRTGHPFALNEVDTAAIKRFAGDKANPATFYSEADNGRIWIRPRAVTLWVATALLVLALLWWQRVAHD